MVASRCPYRLPFRAAAISASTSEPVRYSRVRSTVEFTMVGAVSLPACESIKNGPPKYRTVEQLVKVRTVAIRRVHEFLDPPMRAKMRTVLWSGARSLDRPSFHQQ